MKRLDLIFSERELDAINKTLEKANVPGYTVMKHATGRGPERVVTEDMEFTGLGSNEFYMAFSHIVSGVGANQAELQFGNNSITTSGYSFTQDKNGVQAAASNSTSVFKIHNTSAQVDRLFVAFMGYYVWTHTFVPRVMYCDADIHTFLKTI